MLIKTFTYCIIGTVLEWYDFALFGVLAPILSTIFFPHKDKTTSLLIAFSIFATGFLTRPLGSIFFGHIGDRYGRKKAIILSMLLMCFSTVGIGLLPIHHVNTHLIVMVLVILRLFQGFSVGGETGGIITFVSELFSRKEKLFFYQSFIYAGMNAGILLGTAIGSLTFSVYHHNIQTNVWRLPFLISLLLGIVGLYLRLKAIESPIFSSILQQNKVVKIPFVYMLRKCYRQVIFSLLLMFSGAIVFYYTLFYYPAYINHFLKFGRYLHVEIIGLVCLLFLAPFFSFFYTKNNVRKITIAGFLSFLIFPIPTLILVALYPHQLALVIQLFYIVCYSTFQSLIPTLPCLSFPHEVRYTGLSFCFNVAVLFGGTFPMAAILLTKITGLSFAGGLYMALAALPAIIALLYLWKTMAITARPNH
ncbi:MAG: MFS transporter [Pseudomonadota bacterium]